MRDPVTVTQRDEVIDLDARPAATPAPPKLMSLKVPMPGVVVLVIAGLLAGIGAGYLWAGVQQRGRDAAEVTLFMSVAGLDSASGDGTGVTIRGNVAVVNGGPRPVVVHAVTGPPAGVLLNGSQGIGPGETGWFMATAYVSCARDAMIKPLPAEVGVITADGGNRRAGLKLELIGSRWYEVVATSCEHRG